MYIFMYSFSPFFVSFTIYIYMLFIVQLTYHLYTIRIPIQISRGESLLNFIETTSRVVHTYRSRVAIFMSSLTHVNRVT